MKPRRGPSPEERMIRLSAGIAARRRAGRGEAEKLAGIVAWPRLADSLRARRVLPTLGPRVIELAGAHADSAFETAVSRAMAETRRQAALVALISARIRELLAAAEIRSAPLKGPTLAEAIYGDPGRRLSSDVDLLLTPEDLPRAVKIVRGLGYAAPADPVHELSLPRLHYALVHERGELPPVELHWRIHWYEREFALDRLLPPSLEDVTWRPAPADELASLLLYYARDGLIGLRHPTDIGAWWDARGEQLSPAALDRALGAYGALRPAARAAARAAEEVVGVPTARLSAAGRVGSRGRVAVRLANPLPQLGEAQVFADMGLVDGLLTPSGGYRAFLRRQLLPPREEMPRKPNGRRASRIGRAVRVLGRYGLTTGRLLRSRPAARLGAEP
jgi:hypothetical protein